MSRAEVAGRGQLQATPQVWSPRSHPGGAACPAGAPTARSLQHARGQADLLGAMQGRPLVQLAVRARPDGRGKRPDGPLLSILGVSVSEGDSGKSHGAGGQEGPEVHWFTAPKADPCPGEPASAPREEQALHVGVLGAGLLAMALRPPALVAVDELREEGGLLGIARDELVLQELLGGGPLPGTHRGHQAPGSRALPGEPLALRARRPGLSPGPQCHCRRWEPGQGTPGGRGA